MRLAKTESLLPVKRGFIGALIACCALVAPSVAGAAATPLVASLEGGKQLARMPAMIVFTGDGSGFLAGRGGSARHPGKLRFTSVTASQAVATGGTWLDNCMPSCAQGHFRDFRGTLRLYRPRKLGGKLVFTRFTFKFNGAPPPGPGFPNRSFTRKLALSSNSTYFWIELS